MLSDSSIDATNQLANLMEGEGRLLDRVCGEFSLFFRGARQGVRRVYFSVRGGPSATQGVRRVYFSGGGVVVAVESFDRLTMGSFL